MAEVTPVRSRFEPLSAAWRVLSAPQTLLLLMALVTLALALGVLIPQIPPQSSDDPRAWLAVRVGRLGQLGELFLFLDFFDIFQSLWFRLLLVLTGLSLFVRAVDSAELAWRATRQRVWPASTWSLLGNHPPESQLRSSLDTDELQARLTAHLHGMGYWTVEVEPPAVLSFVAIRRRTLLWARPLGYGGLLLALAGLVVTSAWGWQGEDWQPVPGQSRDVAPGSSYAVRLDAFDLRLGDDQQLQDYSSEITWLEGESEVEREVIGVGRPSTRGGATVRQVGFVPVIRLRGWDKDGHLLTLETEEDALSLMGQVEIRFPSPQARPLVLVPGYDLFLALSFEPLCAEGRPALYVEPTRTQSSVPPAREILVDSGSIRVDDLRFDVELFFTPILRADYRPGMGLVVGGLVLLLAALIALWLAPPWLGWISAGPEEEESTVLRVQALPGVESDRQLGQLAECLQEELSGDA